MNGLKTGVTGFVIVLTNHHPCSLTFAEPAATAHRTAVTKNQGRTKWTVERPERSVKSSQEFSEKGCKIHRVAVQGYFC